MFLSCITNRGLTERLASSLVLVHPYLLLKLVSSCQNRCSVQQSGELSSSSADSVDGIVGFGQANSSIISQLASAGKVKKVFSHCLDGINGGGIFAIGQVVQPKLKTTPLVPNEYVDIGHLCFYFNILVISAELSC